MVCALPLTVIATSACASAAVAVMVLVAFVVAAVSDYVLKSPAALEKARITKASLYSCPLVLLVCYDSETVWKNPGDRCYGLYNAGEQDASIVAASMMFEAEELGVHSLWIRGFDSKTVIDTFDLPANHTPVMMLALGYPAEDSHPAHLHSKRKPLDETVTVL